MGRDKVSRRKSDPCWQVTRRKSMYRTRHNVSQAYCISLSHGFFFFVDLSKEIATNSKTMLSFRRPVDLVLEKLEKQNDARFIVYVRTRELSDLLAELLKSEGYLCTSFTGSSAGSEEGGNTNKAYNEGFVTLMILFNSNILLDKSDFKMVYPSSRSILYIFLYWIWHGLPWGPEGLRRECVIRIPIRVVKGY